MDAPAAPVTPAAPAAPVADAAAAADALGTALVGARRVAFLLSITVAVAVVVLIFAERAAAKRPGPAGVKE